jgi:3-oxoacyl-[acyl-carrier-protein] synthase-3
MTTSEPRDRAAPVGIRSIGWWIPPGRHTAAEIAAAYGLPREALVRLGIVELPVAGPDDHPATMAARATRHALDAAGLAVDQLDLLIYTGATKDWPAPWVAAFGVLHELGATRTAGFDLASRCTGGIDALWLAKTLIDAGTYQRIAVCCAERFDYQLGPHRPPEQASDVAYSAGAAVAIVSRDAGNAMLGFSNFVNPDLAVHRAMAPIAGGSRQPIDQAAVAERLHHWRSQLSLGDSEAVASYSAEADRRNYAALRAQTGFGDIDFVACSPLYPEPQLRVLEELGIPRRRTLFTVPRLGHIGSADLLLILGIAAATDRPIGRRIVLSTRTPVYANALAILGDGDRFAVPARGEGIDLAAWPAVPSVPPC